MQLSSKKDNIAERLLTAVQYSVVIKMCVCRQNLIWQTITKQHSSVFLCICIKYFNRHKILCNTSITCLSLSQCWCPWSTALIMHTLFNLRISILNAAWFCLNDKDELSLQLRKSRREGSELILRPLGNLFKTMKLLFVSKWWQTFTSLETKVTSGFEGYAVHL